jgi:hypothetical protein
MANKSQASRSYVVLGVLLLAGFLIYNYRNRPHHKEPTGLGPIRKSLPQTSTEPSTSLTAAKPSATPPAAALIEAAPKTLSVDEQKKWEALREILSSKNDNDPRLDKDLKNLSQNFHAELYDVYQKLPMEKRNERGLVAFLIARDLKSEKDFDFLKSIYNESPCLSLGDCTTRAASDPHLSNIDEGSMNYPQLTVLYQLQSQLNAKNKAFENGGFREQLKGLLTQAAQFPVPNVQKKAEEIRSQQFP